MKKHLGFTLIELMTVVVVLAILVAIGYPLYQNHQKQTRLREVQAKMHEDALALEQHYRQYKRFRKNTTTWADIPHRETAFFTIDFSGKAQAEKWGVDRYILVAQAKPAYLAKEKRILKLDHHGNFRLCEKKDNKETCRPF